MILGVDPGPVSTAYVLIFDDYHIEESAKIPNAEFRDWMKRKSYLFEAVAVESIQSYGMAVGREVFDTAYQIGRIQQICEDKEIPCDLYARPTYGTALCGGKVSDPVLRQALLLRFGGDRKGEPLFVLKGDSDKRSAFAVAVYHIDKLRMNDHNKELALL